MGYLEMALKVNPKRGNQGNSAILIDQTIQEINKGYPEVRDRLKDTPQWKALSKIEQEINRAALEDDFEGLDRALQAYKQAALTVEGTGSQGSLFEGPGSDKSMMPIPKRG